MRHTLLLALVVSSAAALPLGLGAGGCSGTESTNNGDVGVPAIVFVKRQHTTVGDNGAVSVNVAGGNGQVLDYERYVPGGSLNMLVPPRPDGQLKNITRDFPAADFNGVDVSFDAKSVVFSMKRDANDHYHIYTASLTEGADGKFEIHSTPGGGTTVRASVPVKE